MPTSREDLDETIRKSNSLLNELLFKTFFRRSFKDPEFQWKDVRCLDFLIA
ncbi:unnamed protein product [Larinioides sclopetarius]|uniref:Uncharacterized protein n=1 Tax=Larinioides sclopetarius TaxID=280406 RepID=A0AAV2BQN0_9ARAC